MPISRRAATMRRFFRPRNVMLISVNLLAILFFFSWREHYVSKESLLNIMDDRLKAVFSTDREVKVVEPVVETVDGHLNFTGRAAFASSICMPGDFLAVRALVHSLVKSETQADIVVINMDHIDSHQRRQLINLGAKVVDAELITVKIDESRRNKDEQTIIREERERARQQGIAQDTSKRARMCRDNSIQAFRLSQWDRVIYMSPEMLVLQNVDELFQEPPFAATLDIGGIIDESMLLLEPSMEKYAELRDIMRKATAVPHDLGFLNYFFKDIHPLNPLYNVKASSQQLEYSNYIFGNARIYNYEGSLKPWNFWESPATDWRQMFNVQMMVSWRLVDSELRRKLGIEAELVEWQNTRGPNDVCADYMNHQLQLGFGKLQDKYSVILTAHNQRRQETLPFLIKHFISSEKVDKVFISWQKGEKISPKLQEILSTQEGLVTLVEHSTTTVNNKFNPINELRTAAVLISDDDVWAPIEDLDLAFESWRRQPDALVGFAPRVDCYDHKTETTKYCWPFRMTPGRYSMMLPRLMFADSSYLFLWRCGMPDKFQEYVDGIGNCEDIALNFLIQSVTSQPPMHIASNEVYDFRHENGEERSEEAWLARGECVQRMMTLFGRTPLVPAQSSVVRYSETDFRVSTWDAFLDMVKEKEENARDYHAVTTEDVLDEDTVQNEY
ncbi:glycosyl transferase family 64 domain-containing protein [Lipomyces arxii]|uniref:glycosyl transferase family 64 domain-containing protein n=1 Tax=Lipomyces arxii TaxID=56418 RepID=UPI0034CFD0E0